MSAFRFILLCLVCASAGILAGRYTGIGGQEAAGEKLRRSPALPPSTPSAGKALTAEKSGLRRAAMILAMAGQIKSDTGLAALIDASADDELTLRILAETWLKTDPAAFARAMMLTRLIKSPRQVIAGAVLQDLMTRWGRTDPDAAWEIAASFKGNVRHYLFNQLALTRMEKDPRSGLEFVLAHPGVIPPYYNNELLPRGRDLLPLIQQLPDSAAKLHMIKNALNGLPLAEAFAAMGNPDEFATANARNSLLREAAKTSVNEVISFHSQATGSARYAAAQAVGDALIKSDPAAAVEWAKSNLSGSLRTATIKTAAGNLLVKDPAAATAARALLPENFKPGAGGK